MSLINFTAGPAAIPDSVLQIIQKELLNWQNTGISILETGHRTKQFADLGEKLEASVRRILKVPSDFSVLFLPGGAQIQFAVAVMNLARGFKHANYVETGRWSTKAIKEAEKYLSVHVVASSKNQNFTTIPKQNTWNIKQNAAFLHFTDNETIDGVEYPEIPNLKDIILVSDMSSNLFSRPVDFSKIGCLYACAQKNFGIAGMSMVIIHRDLLDRALPETPSVFHYASQESNKSLVSTPTTFAWYVASLVLDWLESKGGIQEIAKCNLEKSQLLYDFLDSSSFYHNPVEPTYRSRMNVPFTLNQPEKEPDFFKLAQEQGLLYLNGHRSVGGARASIYNAISVDDVKRLIQFLADFKEKYAN